MADAVTVDPSAQGGPGLCMGHPLKLSPAWPSPPRQVSPPSQKRPLIKRLMCPEVASFRLLQRKGGPSTYKAADSVSVEGVLWGLPL